MSYIDELRKRAGETGEAFLQWWDANEETITRLLLSAFLAGVNFEYDKVQKILDKK